MKLSEQNNLTIRQDTVKDEELTYRYTLSAAQSLHSALRTPRYFLKAERLDTDGSILQEATAFVPDPGYALILFEILCTHRVSPAHLSDVIEDFER